MGSIIAIGGGEIATAETRAIDQRAIEAAPGSAPTALFVPTASNDAASYIEKFDAYFGDTLECETAVLELTKTDTTVDAAREAIAAADLIYVGGGDTAFLVDLVGVYDLLPALREHYADGGVLMGLSAGALCWFEYGLSDAIALEDVDFGPTACFGLIEGLDATVHADFQRRRAFRTHVERRMVPGVALGDCTAMEVRDDRYRVLTSAPTAAAFYIDPRPQQTTVRQLPATDDFEPLDELRDPDR
ncbi:MAG: Type 1 glutamine amidotransferase-like domain-containing protein [Halorhabdus sp.]